MSDAYIPLSPSTRAVLQSAAAGATLGAAAATATQFQQDAPGATLALGDIARAAAVTGLAAGGAALVGQSLVCKTSLPRYAAMFAAGTALFYLLNPSKPKSSSTEISGASA